MKLKKKKKKIQFIHFVLNMNFILFSYTIYCLFCPKKQILYQRSTGTHSMWTDGIIIYMLHSTTEIFVIQYKDVISGKIDAEISHNQLLI